MDLLLEKLAMWFLMNFIWKNPLAKDHLREGYSVPINARQNIVFKWRFFNLNSRELAKYLRW
jgi:hypothetical protein